MTTDHERYEQDVGAYLLGALPPLEASVFERHLMGCEDCQRELERLRPAAEALPRAVEAFDPPPTLKASLMDIVEREASPAPAAPVPKRDRFGWLRLRPQLAIGLASALFLVAAVALGVGLTAGDRGSEWVTAEVDRSRLPTASYARVEFDGNLATLHVSGLPRLPDGRVYEVWIEHDGEVKPAGALFTPARDGSGSAAIPGFAERGVDRVMVTREAAGGVDEPTETPVIVADV